MRLLNDEKPFSCNLNILGKNVLSFGKVELDWTRVSHGLS